MEWRKDHGHIVRGAGGLGSAGHAEGGHDATQLQGQASRGVWEGGLVREASMQAQAEEEARGTNDG